MTATLSIDAGQTGTKARLSRGPGDEVESVLPGVRTHEPLLPQLAESARRILRDAGAEAADVSYGVSGLTEREADAGALLGLLDGTGARRVLLAHDSVTSFLGTLGDARGAVVAAGTGVVTLAVGRSAVARVDGWGNVMGDAGSGYWIGREALDAAMRAYDGRGAPTSLLEALRERWPQVEAAYIDLQSDPDRVRVVASFAAVVAAHADGGDAAAARISLAAARELSHSVTTALARVGEPADPADGPAVCAIGGVFGSAVVRTRFEHLVREAHPRVRFEAPHGSGLDGAATLPSLPPDHPLRALVSVAGERAESGTIVQR